MQYINTYVSPLGEIFMSADDIGLTGLWFRGQKYSELYQKEKYEEKDLPIFYDTKKWLDIYFSGHEPGFYLSLHLVGTDFQKEVWEILLTIPYGKTMTYGRIAEIIAMRRRLEQMSAQAVGGAVGRNRISIVVPCHRVMGANGELTGYAGGIERKCGLLKLEKSMR